MKIQFLVNPFVKIAGYKALALGLLLLFISSFLASFNGIHFDGVLDVHLGGVTGWIVPLLENLYNLIILYLFALILCKIFSSSHFRIIDILGTIALSRGPLVLASSVGFLDINTNDPYDIMNIIIGFVMLFFVVWTLILLFHSLRISANLKGIQLWTVFLITVIGGEIISKLLINQFYLLIL